MLKHEMKDANKSVSNSCKGPPHNCLASFYFSIEDSDAGRGRSGGHPFCRMPKIYSLKIH